MFDEQITRVAIVSCEEGPGAWTHQAESLRTMFPAPDTGLILVESPEQADVILITDLRDRDDDFASLRNHPLVRRFPERCFSVTESDAPPRWVRGIHTSATTSPFNFGRFASGSYFLYHPDFRNPFVEKFSSGEPDFARDRKYLYSFLGRSCIALRARLFGLPVGRSDIIVRNTSSFDAFTHTRTGKEQAQREYAEIMRESKFALCPRGDGAASIRLFEAMSLGVAPVIISDPWIFPAGPDWAAFAIVIKEKDLDRIEETVQKHEGEWRERGRLAREAYKQFFVGSSYVRYLVESARDIQRRQLIPETLVHRLWPLGLRLSGTRGVLSRVGRRLQRMRRQRRQRPVRS